ncbi:hypothetical protein [Streptomyces sp. MH60]|uniref:hypothetical protein n=1 Tax=Streptomyces sp. MH60 TaxID=1940758 RepID=UPI000CEE3122|nr:hypothetical protein [Streptomyces sp. MH60]PPS89549.1 hypothetical protein BZZ08_01696 [Streptomyces sp. MH60]
MSETETAADVRTATARADKKGRWWLTVEGTGIDDEYVMVVEDSTGPDYIPGGGLGYRLIERGFMPDRSAGDPQRFDDPVDKLSAVATAGWTRTGPDTWTIPCSPIADFPDRPNGALPR